MPPAALGETGDSATEHFARGSGDHNLYLFRSRSEVVLAPAAVGEFDGPDLPRGWKVEVATEGGSAHIGGGHLALEGAGVYADGLVSTDRSMEFSATFTHRPNQHVGFGLDFVKVPWLAFGTKYGNALYGRTCFYISEDERLGAAFLGQRHHFRIDWRVLDVAFSVDGQRQVHLLVPVPGFMRAGAANGSLGGPPLLVDWLLVTPYRPEGRFTSRVFDAGSPARWGPCHWEAATPPGTELAVEVRAGATPQPGTGWSGWAPVAEPGAHAAVELSGQYAQYRALLTTTDPRATPALRRVTLTYRTDR